MPFDAMTTDITLSAPPTEVLLPHVPSALIRLALADLRKVEAMPETYRVDMGTWHAPELNGTCVVCFAGAVMANTLGAPRDRSFSQYGFGEHNFTALDALDDFRLGCVIRGARCLDARPVEFEREVPEYSDDRPGFHAALHALADAFERSGQ